jgi:putative N6-adenine-specific DNA methylase
VYQCFATTVKGLEPLLANELTSFGATALKNVNAGVQFTASLDIIMKANLHSRIASRIMIQIGFGGYHHEEDIYNLAKKIRWDEWFHVGNSIKVSTSAIRSPLKSLEFITLTVKDALCDYFVNIVDARPDVNKQNPDVRIYNFLTEDTATIYLDTSGEALFKRGYRENKLEAPLKENLAAGIILLANWQPDITLYDPMCGSGTIAMEAVSLGLNIAPGLNRSFGFEKLEKFDIAIFDTLKIKAKQAIKHDQPLKIYASDISRKAVSITEDNFKKAGLLKYLKLDFGDFLSKYPPNTSGMLITNPPYGIRLDEQKQLAEFYPKLGDNLKKRFSNWDCYFLTSDLALAKLIHLKPNKKIPLFNGALECRLFEFKMVAGSNR